MAKTMTISEVCERTKLAPGTIRMWEQRHGWPIPQRTASGYRKYSEADVVMIKHVAAYRARGMSVGAAIERVRNSNSPLEPSIYAAVATAPGAPAPQVLRKSTLHALSRAMEHEALAQSGAAVCFGAFQHESFYRPVESRYRQIARTAEATVVFADFKKFTDSGAHIPIEVPIAPEDALGNEWVVIVDSPGYSACLLAWEQPADAAHGGRHTAERRFESLWTVNPAVVRRAAEVAAKLAGRSNSELGERLDNLLATRPIATDDQTASLTALTNRIVAYVESA